MAREVVSILGQNRAVCQEAKQSISGACTAWGLDLWAHTVAHVRRLKLSKNGFAGQALGESCALLLLRGKVGRCEAPPGAIADAVNALMEALHFPASATVNSQARAGSSASVAASSQSLSEPPVVMIRRESYVH